MVKMMVVFEVFSGCGVLYFSLLIDFIIGGVMVSFVIIVDVIIVELGVLIGFVGLCVI